MSDGDAVKYIIDRHLGAGIHRTSRAGSWHTLARFTTSVARPGERSILDVQAHECRYPQSRDDGKWRAVLPVSHGSEMTINSSMTRIMTKSDEIWHISDISLTGTTLLPRDQTKTLIETGIVQRPRCIFPSLILVVDQVRGTDGSKLAPHQIQPLSIF